MRTPVGNKSKVAEMPPNATSDAASEIKPPATAEEACARAMQAIVQSLPEVINAQIMKASKGSYQHAKFLCEFGGLSGAVASPTAAEEDSLAALLLKSLQIPEDDDEEAVPEQTPLL